jgi:UDP-glucose 4-epimerase
VDAYARSGAGDVTAVLVTGASGLIGRSLLPLFGDHDQVWALSRRERPPADRVRWIVGDLTAHRLPAELPSGVETVIHLAQSEHYRSFPEQAFDIFEINVASTARLIDWARRAGVTRFVYASSGGVESRGGYYLASKKCAELLVENYRSLLHVIVLRPFFVYGEGQRPSMLIPWLVDAVQNGRPIRLEGRDGMRLNPIHVSDAAAAIHGASRLESSEGFDVAGPEILTLRQVADTIGRHLDRAPSFVHSHESPTELVGDITTMTRLVGAPRRTFDSGIADLCRGVRTADRDGVGR